MATSAETAQPEGTKAETAKSETVIREVAPGVWTFSKFFPVGGRSTAVKLADGSLWVLASTPLTDETKAKLNDLGPVKYIVGPDAVHNLFLGSYKEAYPSAALIGVEPHLSKPNLKNLDFAGVYGRTGDDPTDPAKFGYTVDDEIRACYFSGHGNKDVAFLHTASKTLIVADLLFNLPATEQYSQSKGSGKIPVIGKLNPYSWAHRRFLLGQSKDKEAMKRDAKTVAAWDFDRVIPCHGDVIEKDGKNAWNAAYKGFLQ